MKYGEIEDAKERVNKTIEYGKWEVKRLCN